MPHSRTQTADGDGKFGQIGEGSPQIVLENKEKAQLEPGFLTGSLMLDGYQLLIQCFFNLVAGDKAHNLFLHLAVSEDQ